MVSSCVDSGWSWMVWSWMASLVQRRASFRTQHHGPLTMAPGPALLQEQRPGARAPAHRAAPPAAQIGSPVPPPMDMGGDRRCSTVVQRPKLGAVRVPITGLVGPRRDAAETTRRRPCGGGQGARKRRQCQRLQRWRRSLARSSAWWGATTDAADGHSSARGGKAADAAESDGVEHEGPRDGLHRHVNSADANERRRDEILESAAVEVAAVLRGAK